MPNNGYLHNTLLKYNSTIFKQQLKNISTVLNNTGNTTQLLTSFNALDAAQQKVLLSSKLLTEEQKMQCVTMATLSSANTKYTAEQLVKATGISSETLATWGLTEATDSLTMSQLAEMASSDAQAKKVLEKIVAKNAQAVANGKVTVSNTTLAASEASATLATGSFTTAIKANIAAMWTWMTTTPLGWLMLLAAGVFAAVKAYDALTVSVEEANEKIDESRSAYQETTSTIESMNSELEITKQKIEELEAKDVLSFTDKEELDNLREQNNELERSIALQEKKQKNEATQTVADIKQNEDTLNDDFEKSIKNLSGYKKEYEETKQIGLKGMSDGIVTLENYEVTMAAMDKEMSRYEAKVLDNIEKYEQYKEDIINKYGTNDISTFSQSDRSLYENIVNQLQSAYKEIYTDSEYNKFVIEPIFDEDKLKGLQDELLKYFISGGQTDLSSLEEKFGSDIITALRNACIRAGIDFDKMIGDIYNNSQSKLDQIAPIVAVPTGAYDAKQNSISKQIRDYIQNDLSEEDRTILLNVEIPDDAKLRTKQDVDNYIASLKADVDTDETDISISDVFSFKNAENEATILSELNDKLSEVKSAYETCLSAKEEYDEQGYLSVDTLQKVISLGDDYLQYLFDEQGNVKLDAEAFKQLTLARINDMEAQALQNLAENIKQITDEATATEYLAQKQNELASSYTDVAINALLAMQQIKGFSNSEALQGVYNSFKTQYEQIKSLFAHTRSGLGKEFNGISDSAKKATEDAEKATKEYIDSYMNYMEKSLESGRIDYQTYSREVAKFLKDMYDQGKIAAKDYHDYTKQMLEVQKNAMDSVISAVTNRLDKEIDFYEDQIDAVEERYQTEIDYLDTVIEYYEEQKKSLQDTNDELDRQKALEEALYNLHQKQTQKTIELYTADKGKIYTTDASAIRDAEDNVRKAKLDIEIAKLDEAIEKVEQQQDALRDAMDKEKEQLQEIIDRLEEYKEQWQNVAKEYEIAQNEMMASQMLGADWESQILSGRIDTLNTFAQNYIAIQQAIANAAWASANEQIRAAKEAQKAASGSEGGAGTIGGNDTSKTVGGYTPAGMPSNANGKDGGNRYASATVSQRNNNTIMSNEQKKTIAALKKLANNIRKYANGGVVKINPDDLLADLAKQHGEDGFIMVRNGERVLTPNQNASFEKFVDLITGMNVTPQMLMPDFTKFATSNSTDNSSVIVNIGDINLQGVQNAEQLGDAIIKRLPGYITQKFNNKQR